MSKLNRRNFLFGGSAAALLVPAALPCAAINVNETGSISAPETIPSIKTEVETLDSRLNRIAEEAGRYLRKNITDPRTVIHMVYPHSVDSADVYRFSHARMRFDKHLVAETGSLGLDLISCDFDVLRTSLLPLFAYMSNRFNETSAGHALRMARLPNIPKGCGAVSGSWSDGYTTVRSVAFYEPVTMRTILRIDMIYGHIDITG